MPYKGPDTSPEASMAQTPQPRTTPSAEEAFIADRAMFWQRFTTFTKGAVIAIVLLLLGMWIFLV